MTCLARLVGRKSRCRDATRSQGAFEHSHHEGRFVAVLAVEALLVVVGLLDGAEGVLEGELHDVAIGCGSGAGAEVVVEPALHEQVAAGDEIDETRLAAAIGTYDGNVLACLEREVDGLGHAGLGEAAESVLEKNYGHN